VPEERDTERPTALTRRRFLHQTAAGAASATLAGGVMGTALGAPAAHARRVVALPSARRIRADYQRMVDFGPRLPGYVEHDQFCDWLEDEFVAAGLELIPCDEYEYHRWRPKRLGLEVLDGPSPGRVKVATSFVRSAGTPADGVVGPLVNDGASGSVQGSVLLVDLTATTPAPGSYKRLWTGPWPALQPYADRGVKAVVLIVNAPFEELAGNWSPHTGLFQPIPALVLDRDTGRSLREQATARPNVRLTLAAPVKKTLVRSITAVLPGESDHAVIVDTHTDGQNFVEENGAVALVHLARHFASLPPGKRLRHTLVFAAWPGHMAGTLPQAPGWIAAHRDIVKRAAAAVTIEHLGAPEWEDSPDKGYRPTGRNELYLLSVTQGLTTKLVTKALAKADLGNHVITGAPVITVGSAFHEVGVPHVGGIAGPTYLLVVSKNGELDKLDAKLAAKQTAFYADVIRHLDGADAAKLRIGAPTLGSKPLPTDDESKPMQCGPANRFIVDAGKGRRLAVRFYGRSRPDHGVLVTVAAIDRAISGVTVELRRGKAVYARSAALTADDEVRRVLLRRHAHKRFPRGAYSLVVRRHGKVLDRRSVRVGNG
jgi:hypothetical protein